MDKGAIVRKTDKGEEEIRTRSHGLEKELRHVLILVDGRSSVAQLAQKGPGWDVEGRLVELAKQGFVTIQGLSEETLNADVGTIREKLVQIAEEVLGGDSAKVVQKLKAAPENREGLLETVSQCKKMVKLLIDEKKAEQLQSRCQAVLAGLK